VTVGPDLIYNGGFYDVFVAKVNASGTALSYCGYIGGSGEDNGYGIAVDGSGNAYVIGRTWSTETTFPVIVGPDLTHNGGWDVFVARVSASGTGLLSYCGYIGGSDDDFGYGIAVDGSGNAYVTGRTSSTKTTFPVIVGPDLTENGGRDAFVAKVNASGTALPFCGYIAGSSWDYGYGIAVDGLGNAYVTGYTYSTEATFPVTVGPDLTHNGIYDAFVAKVNASGTALIYCGYIGGSDYDYGYSIAVDGSGNAYVTGETISTEATFPVTVGPDLTHNGSYDAFVARTNASGTALIYCGYIGGSDYDHGYGIAVDGSGNAYMTGYTASTEATFPITIGPDWTRNGDYDAFLAKISPQWCYPVFDGHDFDGNGTSDVSVWRPTNSFWYIKDIQRTGFGMPGDIPVSGDYNGDGTTDIAIFRPSTAMWAVKDQFRLYYGLTGDIPVPGDYDGNGTTDVAIYRPSTGMWAVKDQFVVYLGGENDVPVPGDYNGDGKTDVAVFNVFNGHWRIRNIGHFYLGTEGDIPVPADYDGDGKADVAIFRPSNGMWVRAGMARVYFGTALDLPVPGDYDGNGTADIAVFRPLTGMWAVKDQFRVFYGVAGDIPLVR